jgi:hypothetical protein
MKLTEKELNEFPTGTKITTKYNTLVKTGNDLYAKCDWTECFYENKDIITGEFEKIEIPTYTEYIPPKPILDEKEKEYLSAVIKPYKKKIKYIVKEKLCCNNGESKEYIVIITSDCINSFDLPVFRKGTMYKGMELDREYSLDELRIVR